jgi:DNA (cytosine-5)-methyltransferase 1
MSEATVLELCAGYNGLGMAVEAAFNARTAAFSEFDAAPSKILAYRYPGIPNYGDMTKIDWAGLGRRHGRITIVSGGTPCQDLSAAGKRRGMNEGTRSNLWVQMREAIAELQPEWVVWENVRGAYSAEAASDMEQCPGCMGDTGDGGTVLRALGRVLGDLSDLGYDAEWRGLRAADVGACHARFRVFVLARRRNTGDANSQGMEGLRAGGVEEPRVAAEAWGHGGGGPVAADGDDAGRGEQRRTEPVPTEHTATKYTRTDAAYADDFGHNRTGRGPEQDRRTEPTDGSQPATDAESIGWGEGRTEPARIQRGPDTPVGVSTNWGDYTAAIERWERVTGRRAPRPTEPTGRTGAERLSARFTEWMMGLPDGWLTAPEIGLTRSEQLKACGNGVVPQQAYAALMDMIEAFQQAEEEQAA